MVVCGPRGAPLLTGRPSTPIADIKVAQALSWSQTTLFLLLVSLSRQAANRQRHPAGPPKRHKTAGPLSPPRLATLDGFSLSCSLSRRPLGWSGSGVTRLCPGPCPVLPCPVSLRRCRSGPIHLRLFVYAPPCRITGLDSRHVQCHSQLPCHMRTHHVRQKACFRSNHLPVLL